MPSQLSQIGVVVHPARDIDLPLHQLREWAQRHEVRIGQIPLERETREVAEPVEADAVQLLLAIGGDGTTLAAIRAAATANVPVLGIACGSLGVLTTVPEASTAESLERFHAGRWKPREIPALVLRAEGGEERLAFNDCVVLRQGEGQVRVFSSVAGERFSRLAGDGCIVATPLGSSAYSLAAGGPLLPLGLPAFLLTSLPSHGGFHPPLLIAAGSELELEITGGFGGARLEIDGQKAGEAPRELRVTLRRDVVDVVTFENTEPLITGLRRRGIIADSPRILADEARRQATLAEPGHASPSRARPAP
jgi:NAD+ kinase